MWFRNFFWGDIKVFVLLWKDTLVRAFVFLFLFLLFIGIVLSLFLWDWAPLMLPVFILPFELIATVVIFQDVIFKR